MIVNKIDTSKKHERQKFAGVPFDIYRGNPYWVPPLESEIHFAMNKNKHPLYAHSEADFFILEEGSKTIGRIAVVSHKNYSDYYKIPTGFFYYYECINNNDGAAALFTAAVEWCRARQLRTIIGPRGLLRSNGYGLLVEGFDYMPALGIPYNPPYYADQIESFGFIKETDLISGYLEPSVQLPEKLFQAADKVKQRDNFHVLKFKKKRELRKWIHELDKIYHQAFLENPNYYPSTHDEFEIMADNIYRVAIPELVKIILKEGQTAGFLLAYPNIGRALQRTKGRLWPFGWIDILHELKTTKHIDLNGVGLLPEFQGRGANMLMYAELERTLRDYNAQYGETVQVDERNFISRSDVENAGGKWNKRHRLYRLNIE